MLAAICETIDFPVKETYSETEVVDLATKADFDIDGEALALTLKRGWVPVPFDRRKWAARDVMTLLEYLERNRLWRPCSDLHAHKKSRARLEREELESEGRSIPNLDATSLRGLLLMMTECHNRELREGFLEAVTAKLHLQQVDLDA